MNTEKESNIPPEGTLEFIREYHKIGEELADFLDIDNKEPNEMSPMAIRLNERYTTLGEMALEEDVLVGFRLARLGILANHLRLLKEEHPQMFSEFKADFHEIEHNRYFGWRCEVDTAATLTEWGVDFTHPDPPDFRLERLGETVSIECTSAHYRGSSVDVGEKLKDAVSSKANKEYIAPSTALFIDVTNLYHNAAAKNEKLDSGTLKKWVQDRSELIGLEIGSVILLGYIGNVDSFILHHASDRVDISPSESLLDFLDEYIPFGEGSMKIRWFPPEP